MLNANFRKAQNKTQDPAKLERLIKIIEKEQWFTLPVDVKGAIYNKSQKRNAHDVKGGAGETVRKNLLERRECEQIYYICLLVKFLPIKFSPFFSS